MLVMFSLALNKFSSDIWIGSRTN